MKLYIEPSFSTPDRAEGGIRRVVEAMTKHLPDFGFQIVPTLEQAEITNGHGVMIPVKTGIPFVSSCHGLHWADYEWSSWAHEVNARVVQSLVIANAITAPSEWVGYALTRGILRRPTVIYHGVDPDEWRHDGSHGNYVLWNKARADPVSNPDDMVAIAGLMQDVKFISTVGDPKANIEIAGVVPQPQLKRYIQQAGVYLATARETF